ncbi:hypothetical protein C1646_791663 [Rhizophagus diaphanus]|nr:hypothetical protein C1646_791663 [Rhizophagus diaphanus] [Rhizophagus sp. MUCL 43196]
MKIPIIDGTIHPDEWVKQVQTICIINNIRQERDILKICKLNIDSSITVPGECNNLNDLVKALKAHPTFSIYKDGIKHKLDQMKFEGGEGGDTTAFLAEFRSHCDKAEIDPQEIKNRLLRTYSSNEFFENEFSKRVTDVTSIDEIYKIYSEVVADSTKIIKYGPEFLISIKHIETGRYLSSRQINYETGSQRQVLFADEKILDENAWWYLTCEAPDPQKKDFQKEKVLYDDKIYLTHNKTKAKISFSNFYMAPVTGHLEYVEAHCSQFAYSVFNFVKSDQTNKMSYLKARDRVYLRTTNYVLHSHGVNFAISNNNNNNDNNDNDNKNDIMPLIFQEVVGYRHEFNNNDMWLIERKSS